VTAGQAAGVPTARQLRVRLRRARRGHHARSLGDFLTDLYVLAWFVLMYGWVLVDAGRDYLHSPTGGGQADPVERYWIGAAAVLAAAGLAWQGLRAMGPLLVTPAAQAWAVSAPVDRRAWLLPRFGALVTAAALTVATLAAAAAAMSKAPDARSLGWAALAGAGCGGAGAALSVVAQGAGPGRRWPRLPGLLLAGAGAVVAAMVIGTHFTGGRLGRPTAPVAVAVAVAGPPLAVMVVTFAVHVLPRVDRATLTTGAQFATAAVSAAVWMDPSLLAGVLENRRWRGIGRVKSRRFLAGPWWWAMLQAEVRRLYRHPTAILTWGALVLAQYALALALPSVAGPAQVVGAYLAANRMAGGLRSLSRSPGLRRALGGSDTGLRLVHLVVPAVGAALWWLVTAPVGGPHLSGGMEVLLVAGVVGAVYRAATRPPMSYGGAVVETPFGLIPVDLLRQLTRGLDVVAVLVIAQNLLS
jgi:hypothetical protein